jgi:hypothetical protein
MNYNIMNYQNNKENDVGIVVDQVDYFFLQEKKIFINFF